MDKRVVFAVAGSGKTSSIIERVEESSRCLIVTYTDNNTQHLKNRIINKLGKLPSGVRVYSYFTFLYSFCFRPIHGYDLGTKGINFTYPLPVYAQRTRKDTREHYIDKHDRLYSNRIAKMLIELEAVGELKNRIEKFFDLVCIDEVQDFAANDFNLLCHLASSNVEMLLMGDFYQHTFDTSKDGATQKNLHDCFKKYQKKLESGGYSIDLDSLSHSYRCSPAVCEFVNDNIGIKISSHRNDNTEICHVDDHDEVRKLFHNNSVVKLFYQKSHAYTGNTANWGNTKGLDHYQDVCVVLNPSTFKKYNESKLSELAPTTKNKLYVACTRARGNLYFVSEPVLKKAIS